MKAIVLFYYIINRHGNFLLEEKSVKWSSDIWV